jgi:spermidine synthase
VQIASVETDFQHIYIVDVLRPGLQSLDDYHRSLSDDGSYQSVHPELFTPDRIIFLDGVLQSRLSGDAAYHETLVHPGMFAHPNPKRVAIIGGGEGATLREVLKHDTVETVFMVEIDEMMVQVSREFLPSWSDCSNVVGSTPNCFDDPRVELHHMDAFKWFIENFSSNGTEAAVEPFDVIIMDAL